MNKNMKQYKDQTLNKYSVAEITQGPKSRILKTAVYEVLVSVTPSVHVVQVQVQARQTKKSKTIIYTSQNSNNSQKKTRLERLKKAKGRTLDCDTYKEKDTRMQGTWSGTDTKAPRLKTQANKKHRG